MRIKLTTLVTLVSLFVFSCYLNEPDDPPVRLINTTEHYLIYFIFNMVERAMLDVDPCIKIEGHEDKIINPSQTIILNEHEDFDPGRRTVVLLYNTRINAHVGKMGTLTPDDSFDIDPCGKGMAPFYKYIEYDAEEIRANDFKIIIRD
jgi:hypothetical protein